MKLNLLYSENDILGESPIWNPQQQLLYWIDIEKAAIHCLDPQTMRHQQWVMPEKIGCIAFHVDGCLLVALHRSIVHFNIKNEKITPLLQPFSEKDFLKFNDGCCDAKGRFWIGTADIKEQYPIGDLRCLSAGQLTIKDHGFTVSNGIGWSPDNRLMYFVDSVGRTIYRYDYDLANGLLSNRNTFAVIQGEAGYPDGLTVDNEGFIWCAHWDGWRITRYAPDGQIDCVIPIPVQRVTSCCFGGANLDQLFITSARCDLTTDELAKGPLAGSVFMLETGIKGRIENYFK